MGKAFDITYVRLKFHTSRPESFAIYKRTGEDGPWVPYQYYSGSCENTYHKPNRGFIRTGEDEQQALCTDEFSDISPLTGGNVAFSTLEGRPSAYNFDNSPVLQAQSTIEDFAVCPHVQMRQAQLQQLKKEGLTLALHFERREYQRVDVHFEEE
ncbi:UNVERIFIED_CONTAM: Laminin subunit gamma-1 [Gekko kuhli]